MPEGAQAKDLWERSTLAMVGHDLDLLVEHWDVASRQGVPDGRFLRGDRTGFVEVTTLADTALMSGQSVYLDLFAAWRPGGLSWSFTVNISPDVDTAEFERHIPELARAMEIYGINDPRQVLDLEHIVSPGTAIWCEELMQRLEMHGSHQTDQPGTIYAVPSMGSSGMVPSDPNVILPAVVRTMADPTIERRLAKLAATGDTEQHLVVTVRDGMWEWEPTYFLATRNSGVPDRAPEVPAHLDGLWLFATINRMVLRWLRSSGWAWVPFPALDHQ